MGASALTKEEPTGLGTDCMVQGQEVTDPERETKTAALSSSLVILGYVAV